MGRIVRYLSLFLLLLFALVMRCELFHMQLTNSFYSNYQSMEVSISELEYDSFSMLVRKEEEKKNCSLFWVVIENESRLHQKINIYSDSSSLKKELGKNNIYSGEFKSFFSGSSSIEFKTIAECDYKQFNQSRFLISTGDEQTTVELYHELCPYFEISYPRYYQNDEKDMIIIIWMLVAIAIIISCACDVLYQRKEIVVREIYGENIKRLVIKKAIVNFIYLQAIYFSAKLIVFLSSEADYYPKTAFILFEIACVIGSFLYLGLLNVDVKKIISNGNEDKEYLIFLKILKFITYIVVFFSLATNISGANHFQRNACSDTFNDSYSDANFIYFRKIIDKSCNMKEESNEIKDTNELWEKLYDCDLNKIRPVISIKVAEEYSDYLIMNEYAQNIIPDMMKYVEGDQSDVYVLYRNNSTLDSEVVNALISFYFVDKNLKVKTIPYDEKVQVSYVDMKELSGFGKTNNPIIVYCSNTNMIKVDRIADDQNVIYNISINDFQAISERYHLLENGIDTELTNVGEYISYQKNFLKRMIQYLSSLCSIVLLMDFFIMIAVTKLEYKKNGMEYAIKKILGYGVWQKNKQQILQNMVPNTIISTIFCIIGRASGLYSIQTGVVVSVVLLGAEMVILLFYITRMENNTVSKILKGGCL